MLGSDYQSQTFSTLLSNRENVSSLVGSQNPNANLLPSGYYSGYSSSQQEVVLGSFLTAYLNNPVNERNIDPVKNTPLPNWTINYNRFDEVSFCKKTR